MVIVCVCACVCVCTCSCVYVLEWVPTVEIWDLIVVCPPPLLWPSSYLCTSSDYHVDVMFKCRPVVEKDIKLYCSDNSLSAFSSTVNCLEPFLMRGCLSQKCQLEAFIKWVLLFVTYSMHVLLLPCTVLGVWWSSCFVSCIHLMTFEHVLLLCFMF